MTSARKLNAVDRVHQEIAVLEANEERVRLAMKAGRIYFWDWDVAEDYIVWFGGLEKELLLDFAPSSANEFKALVHPDDLDLVGKKIEQALRGPGDYEVEFRMLRKDGTVRWTSTRAVVIRDCFGFGVRMVGVDQDTSSLREALKNATENQDRLRVALESLAATEAHCTTATWECDLRNNKAYASSSYRRMYGFDDMAPIVVDTWIDRVHPDDRDAAKDSWRRLIDNGSRYDFEYRILHPTMGEMWLVGIGILTRDGNGSPLRFTGINVDITERKRDAAAPRGHVDE